MNNSKSLLPPMGLVVLLLLGSNCFGQEWHPVEISAQVPATQTALQPSIKIEQLPAPEPASPSASERWLPEFVSHLPKPPDEPASLFHPPAAGQPYASTAPRPYFESDPLLDPLNMPSAGWFYSLDVQAAAPHIFKSIYHPVTVGTRPTEFVELPNRGLDWTVAPRFELGYNLPSGFGGFALSYRFLGSSGNVQIFGPDGLAPLHSRLDLNVADLDYVTREFTPNDPIDRWTMRWRIGVRFANMFYDSTLNQAPATAAVGTGVLQQHAYNQLLGAGPHAAIELTHQLGIAGLSLLGRADIASVFATINQGVSETALNPGGPSGVSFGRSGISSSQTSPSANLRLGLDWQPPNLSKVHCFAGYQYEYWWNVGRFSLQPQSRGELSIQGFVLRFEFNY